jgi:hypothetical protein
MIPRLQLPYRDAKLPTKLYAHAELALRTRAATHESSCATEKKK